MTTDRSPFATRLRQDLHEWANAPGPPGLADRALARARKVRRWRVGLAGAGAISLAALIAVPVANGWRVGGFSLPFGAPRAGVPCESATDEAEPPNGVPFSRQPKFVRVIMAKLPPRDDYFLQSAYGICANPDAPGGSIGERPSGYAVINLGPNRENGHLTVTIRHEAGPVTCATVPTPPEQLLFCEDATATTPLVLGARNGGVDDFTVTAIYLDARAVSMGAIGTPFDVATVRSVVTDPALVELLA